MSGGNKKKPCLRAFTEAKTVSKLSHRYGSQSELSAPSGSSWSRVSGLVLPFSSSSCGFSPSPAKPSDGSDGLSFSIVLRTRYFGIGNPRRCKIILNSVNHRPMVARLNNLPSAAPSFLASNGLLRYLCKMSVVGNFSPICILPAIVSTNNSGRPALIASTLALRSLGSR